jgi:hypothetical protein
VLVVGCSRSSNYGGGHDGANPDSSTDGPSRDAPGLDASPSESGSDSAAPDSARADSVVSAPGLIALYLFDEGSGTVVKDHTALQPLLDLHIAQPASVTWQADGLEFHNTTIAQSPLAAQKVIDACKKSNTVTVEAWITPTSNYQMGEARIVTISDGSMNRNLTLLHQESSFVVRLRTSTTDDNGAPYLHGPLGITTSKLTHLVFTRSAAVDGDLKAGRGQAGDFSTWDASFRLAIANEINDPRPWLGTFHMLAIFDRALDAAEVKQRFQAGPP